MKKKWGFKKTKIIYSIPNLLTLIINLLNKSKDFGSVNSYSKAKLRIKMKVDKDE